MAGLVDYGVDSDRESNESPNNLNSSTGIQPSQELIDAKPLPNDASTRTKRASFDKETKSSKSGHSKEVHKTSSSSSKNKEIGRHHKHRKQSRSRERSSHSRKRSRSRSRERKERHHDQRKKKGRSKSRSRSRSSSPNRKERKSSRRTRSQERREKKAATIARMGLDVTNVAASLIIPSGESKHPQASNLSSVKQTPQNTSSAAGSSLVISSAVQAAAQQVLQTRVAEAQQVTGVTLPSFYNPAAVNPMKYAQQIQKRKLLWSNKQEKNEPPATSTAKIWGATAFTQDQDGKMTAKFKRLMGIKNDSSEGGVGGSQTVEDGQPESTADVLKKQQELFASLDQQYQVARATTHTQRGLGLGFGSASSSYPR